MKWEHAIFYGFALLSYFGMTLDYVKARRLRNHRTQTELDAYLEVRASLRSWYKVTGILTIVSVLLIARYLKNG